MAAAEKSSSVDPEGPSGRIRKVWKATGLVRFNDVDNFNVRGQPSAVSPRPTINSKKDGKHQRN